MFVEGGDRGGVGRVLSDMAGDGYEEACVNQRLETKGIRSFEQNTQ